MTQILVITKILSGEPKNQIFSYRNKALSVKNPGKKKFNNSLSEKFEIIQAKQNLIVFLKLNIT